jgi:3-deoxy-manno-octulosonate cytidylyltransferase (CMP-KDO synthetase)
LSNVAVIPARYASTRFCGKPLAKDTGFYLIEHVYRQVSRARMLDDVIVATDDGRILDAVRSFGGHAVMTRSDHLSGTDRVAEVVEGIDCELVVNVQGDEPEIEPESIDALVRFALANEFPVATLACSFGKLAEQGIDASPDDPGCVKVAFSEGRATYFSRSVVPYVRSVVDERAPYLHLGIYAYRRSFLLELATLAPTPLERTEGLEQLRVLEHGHSIGVLAVDRAAVGIDTPEDYAKFVARYRAAASDTMV